MNHTHTAHLPKPEQETGETPNNVKRSDFASRSHFRNTLATQPCSLRSVLFNFHRNDGVFVSIFVPPFESNSQKRALTIGNHIQYIDELHTH